MARKEIQVFSVAFLDLLSGALGAVILLYIIVPKLGISEEEFEEQQRLSEEVSKLGLQVESLRELIPASDYEEISRQMEEIEAAKRQLESRVASMQSELDDQAQQINQYQSTVDHLQREISEANSTLNQYAEDLERIIGEGHFILVTMVWKTKNHDVDLHIETPWGNEYYYKNKVFPGRPGELTLDNTSGPGLEVWTITQPPSGIYRIYAKFYARNGNTANTEVEVKVYHRNGQKTFPKKALTTSGENSEKVKIGEIVVPEEGVIEII